MVDSLWFATIQPICDQCVVQLLKHEFWKKKYGYTLYRDFSRVLWTIASQKFNRLLCLKKMHFDLVA